MRYTAKSRIGDLELFFLESSYIWEPLRGEIVEGVEVDTVSSVGEIFRVPKRCSNKDDVGPELPHKDQQDNGCTLMCCTAQGMLSFGASPAEAM